MNRPSARGAMARKTCASLLVSAAVTIVLHAAAIASIADRDRPAGQRTSERPPLPEASCLCDEQGDPPVDTATPQAGTAAFLHERVDSLVDMGEFLFLTGGSSALVVDPRGDPHIASGAHTGFPFPRAGLCYLTRQASRWVLEEISDPLTDGLVYGLALDARGDAHVCSVGYGGDSLRYANNSGAAWSVAALGELGLNAPAGMAVGARGVPHFAYVASDQSLRYVTREGVGWLEEAPEGQSSTTPWVTSVAIAVDAAGRPGLAYVVNTDRPSTPFELRLATRDRGAWRIENVLTFGSQPRLDPDWIDIALGANGDASIAYIFRRYHIPPFRDSLAVATRTNGAWEFETVTAVDPLPGRPSLVLDVRGRPHVAFAGQAGLQYARREADGWVIETVQGGIQYCENISLALGPDGRPHFAYRADAVLRYARRASPGRPADVAPRGASIPEHAGSGPGLRLRGAHPYRGGELAISMEGADLSSAGPYARPPLQIHDVGGRIVRRIEWDRTASRTVNAVWDGRDDRGSPVPSGIYFVRTGEPGRTRGARIVVLR